MTRDAGQLTTRQAILGGLAILAVAAIIVMAITLLVGQEEPVPPTDAPAEPAEAQPCPPTPEPGVHVSADELIECPATYDHQVVRYRGEAVRAVLPRGDRAWLQLNDDAYALDIGPLPAHRTAVGGNSGIPVSIPIAHADRITHVGDARHQGDILEVHGIFLRADPADHGGPSIHAHTVEIQQPGHPVTRPVDRPRTIAALATATLAVGTTAAARHSRRRS